MQSDRREGGGHGDGREWQGRERDKERECIKSFLFSSVINLLMVGHAQSVTWLTKWCVWFSRTSRLPKQLDIVRRVDLHRHRLSPYIITLSSFFQEGNLYLPRHLNFTRIATVAFTGKSADFRRTSADIASVVNLLRQLIVCLKPH